MKINTMMGVILVCAVVMFSGCQSNVPDEYGCFVGSYNYYPCRDKAIYNSDTCIDSATLVATTTGSPNEYSCTNKHHKMRVEASTKAGEEIGALVFCECVK